MAWHNTTHTAQRGTAHGMAQYGTEQHRMAWHGKAQNGTAWHVVEQHGMARCSTARQEELRDAHQQEQCCASAAAQNKLFPN